MRHKKIPRRIWLGGRTPYQDEMQLKSTLRRILFWPISLLGIVWALPLTLFGLLLALPVIARRGHVSVFNGGACALVVRGPLADRMLARHPFGVMSAMAIGHVVLVAQDALTTRILTHELEHVSQAARWGILFPFAYLAASAWELLHGRDAYWHNTFEVAARNAERHI